MAYPLIAALAARAAMIYNRSRKLAKNEDFQGAVIGAGVGAGAGGGLWAIAPDVSEEMRKHPPPVDYSPHPTGNPREVGAPYLERIRRSKAIPLEGAAPYEYDVLR